MKLTFVIEASQPCGTRFRLALGVSITPILAWVAAKLAGLF